MKKIFAISLVACLLLSSCGNASGSGSTDVPQGGESFVSAISQEEPAGGQSESGPSGESEFVVRLPGEYDFDRDGRADTIELISSEACSQVYTLRVRSAAGVELYQVEDLAASQHSSGSLFVCRTEEGDHLLRYYHIVSNGWGLYEYELLSLSNAGEKQVLDEGYISFDVMCGSPQFSGEFDEEIIAGFLERIHGYLDSSELIFSMQTGAEERGLSGEFYTVDDFTGQTGGSWSEKVQAFRAATEAEWQQIVGTKEQLPFEYDFDHDGEPDVLEMVTHGEGGGGWLELMVSRADGTLLWSQEGSFAHAGWINIFACEIDGKDYILDYNPGMWQGFAGYSYRLFSLSETGEEILLRENAVGFDLNFGSALHESFDVEEVGAFLEEVHGYLEQSVCLLSTSGSGVTTGDSGVGFREDVFEELYEEEGTWAEKLTRLEQQFTA